MKKWLRRIRAAVTMGLIWAVPWAIVAVLIGMLVDPDESMDEMWWLIGAYPGFLGGVLFSIVLGIAERHRKLGELSVPRFGAWGAVAGLLIGVLAFVLGTPSAESPRWLGAVVIGTMIVMGAVSAAGSLALARKAEQRELLDAGADAADMRLRDGE
jgi:peptidoglycan/LPS O-acetylase OafA/YrhL